MYGTDEVNSGNRVPGLDDLYLWQMQHVTTLHSCVVLSYYADSHAPTWVNNLEGHVNLRDAIRRTIMFTAPNGKQYKLRGDGKLATLLVRWVVHPPARPPARLPGSLSARGVGGDCSNVDVGEHALGPTQLNDHSQQMVMTS